MKLLKKHLNSLKELHNHNKLNIKPILDMEAELRERDKDSCMLCEFYKKGLPDCDDCCNHFESAFKARKKLI